MDTVKLGGKWMDRRTQLNCEKDGCTQLNSGKNGWIITTTLGAGWMDRQTQMYTSEIEQNLTAHATWRHPTCYLGYMTSPYDELQCELLSLALGETVAVIV